MKIEGDLSRLEALLGRFAFGLTPRERKRLASKIGQSLRRSNAARIAKNVEPDGKAMEPRKPRAGKTGRTMFPNLRRARVLKIRPTADGVEIGFRGQAQSVAQTHHFGELDAVGRARDGRIIRTRYAERRLLGVGPDDEEAVLAAIETHLSTD